MRTLVTICARGGSRGLPGKHLKLLHGKPLIAWTLKQARAWGGASDIILSSDDADILKLGRKSGVNILNRPINLAKNDSPKLNAIRHAWQFMEKATGQEYDAVMDLDVTNPCRTVQNIVDCHSLFMAKRPSTLVSVVESRRNPYFNMIEMDSEGKAALCKTLPSGVYRRQDAPACYDLNCNIYIYSRIFLEDEDNLSPITKDTIFYIMPAWTFCDIDSEIDFKIVEMLLKNKPAMA